MTTREERKQTTVTLYNHAHVAVEVFRVQGVGETAHRTIADELTQRGLTSEAWMKGSDGTRKAYFVPVIR
ncbi:MAG: hypothetical protein BGO94_10710 [Micrococcales bacterium 72-143]|nr:MAG: hypothetical protein BGO94_10710 [Micrococcales bacterium 72-143]